MRLTKRVTDALIFSLGCGMLVYTVLAVLAIVALTLYKVAKALNL